MSARVGFRITRDLRRQDVRLSGVLTFQGCCRIFTLVSWKELGGHDVTSSPTSTSTPMFFSFLQEEVRRGRREGQAKRKGQGRENPLADIVGLRNEVCVAAENRRIVDRK